ncbi:hypothetical protein RB653_002915 [Dictyostelium firmibasis]|uniref:Uncharacterized protein n=1 Tax=Dictyostelium firmibasis TaxID=79012 RepID=A0AAN7TPN5_9MYCE
MFFESLAKKKLGYEKLPEFNKVEELVNEIKKLVDSNNVTIKETAIKFGVLVPTEFSRVLIFSSLSKETILKVHIEKIQYLVNLFIEFFKLVSQFNREAIEISLDIHFENVNLGVKDTIVEMENIYSRLIQTANEILIGIEKSMKKGTNVVSYQKQPPKVTLKSINQGETTGAVYRPITRYQHQSSLGEIENIGNYMKFVKDGKYPSVQKLLDKNSLNRIILNSGGTLFLLMSCATVVVGVVLAPFTCGVSLFPALVSVFMVAGGSFCLVGGTILEVFGNKHFIEKKLDLENSLKTLKQMKVDIEKMLASLDKNSKLISQLKRDFQIFKNGEYGGMGILCRICNMLLKDGVYLSDGEDSTKIYCRGCITEHYRTQQQLVGGNDNDLFTLPNSLRTFNLSHLKPICEALEGVIKKTEERFDEWEKKLLLIFEQNNKNSISYYQ